MTKDVLVIDGDLLVFQNIKTGLEDECVKVFHSDSMEEALHKVRLHNYNLIIIQMQVFNSDIYDMIAMVRKLRPMPILILSESLSTANKVKMFNNGADDVLEIPFNWEECFARAQALLRRYTDINHRYSHSHMLVCHENVLLDTARRMVCVAGKEVQLARKEYGIILYLFKNPDQVLTYKQIYEEVWEAPYFGDKDTIFYHIQQLRQKLGIVNLIQTVYGVGYRLK